MRLADYRQQLTFKTFSITSGTEIISLGLISLNAGQLFVDGVLERIVIWHPYVNGKRNSKAHPYVWARGKNETTGSPGLSGMWFWANLTLAVRLLCVNITPLGNPVVPPV